MKVSIIKIIHHYEVFLTYTSLDDDEKQYYKEQIAKAKQLKKQGKTVITWDEFYAV